MAHTVTFPGMLTGPLKWSAFAAAEAFVLPSFSEGLSVGVLEAMGVGLPVIVTQPCNMPEVKQHHAGWEIESAAEPLTAALGEMLANTPAENRAIGRRGARLIANRYNWTAVARQMQDLYRWVESGAPPDSIPSNVEFVLPVVCLPVVRLTAVCYFPGPSMQPVDLSPVRQFVVHTPAAPSSSAASGSSVGAPLVRFGMDPVVVNAGQAAAGLRRPHRRGRGHQAFRSKSSTPGTWSSAITSGLASTSGIDNLTTVRIGSNCCLSQGAYFCTGNHDWSDPKFGLIVKSITLGDGRVGRSKIYLHPRVRPRSVAPSPPQAQSSSVPFPTLRFTRAIPQSSSSAAR